MPRERSSQLRGGLLIDARVLECLAPMLIYRLGNLFHNVPGLRRRETELICRAHGVLKSGSSALISDEHALIDALSGHYRRTRTKRWRQLQSVNPGHVWHVTNNV